MFPFDDVILKLFDDRTPVDFISKGTRSSRNDLTKRWDDDTAVAVATAAAVFVTAADDDDGDNNDDDNF